MVISPKDRVGRKIDRSQNKTFYCRICGIGFVKQKDWSLHALNQHTKAEKTTEHPNFLPYQLKIINHPNFAGMPDALDDDGNPRWVAAKDAKLGIKRLKLIIIDPLVLIIPLIIPMLSCFNLSNLTPLQFVS